MSVKMEEYIVTAPFVSIKAGQVLILSKDQIKRRKSLVIEGKNGMVEVIADFHLKNGEVFSTGEEVNKRLVKSIELKEDYDKRIEEEEADEQPEEKPDEAPEKPEEKQEKEPKKKSGKKKKSAPGQ